jgi:hypothetical protein
VGVVGVQVGDQDKIRSCSVRGRNRAADPTEMAQPSGQDGVEKDGRIAVPPRASAVPPPRECARHGAACSLLQSSSSGIGLDHHHRCRCITVVAQVHRRWGAGSGWSNLQVRASSST